MYETHTVVGYVGGKPELRVLSDGTYVANFSVAVNRKWTDANGVKQERVTWYRVACWRKLAEIVANYLDKGKLVLVKSSQLTVNAYTAKDGSIQSSIELTADDVRFLGSAPVETA